MSILEREDCKKKKNRLAIERNGLNVPCVNHRVGILISKGVCFTLAIERNAIIMPCANHNDTIDKIREFIDIILSHNEILAISVHVLQ